MTAFPQQPLDLRTELQLTAGTWTDISSDAYQRDGTSPPVVISRGRPDESSQATASAVTFELNNRLGRYSPKNAMGPYFGQLGRNTPVRFSVPSQNNYLRFEGDNSSYASTPSSSALNVAGDLELQVDCNVAWSANAAIPLLIKWGGSGEFSWYAEVSTSGTVNFWRSHTGSDFAMVTSTLALPAGRTAVKITYASSSGTVTWYTAPTISGPWTQLGAAQSFGSGATLFASTAAVSVGNAAGVSVTGSVFAAKVLSGIGGTVVASPVFSSQSAGTTSFADAQGNTWTLNGTAEISSRSYRGHFEMSSLPPKWDVTGNDIAVPVTGGGLLRRLGQGNAPVMSPLKRGTLLQTGNFAPLAYWTMEDAAGATSFGSATGGLPMTFDTIPAPTLATDSSFLCSAPLPALNGSRLHGRVPAYSGHGSIVVRFLLKLGTTIPAGGQALMRVITTGTATEFTMYALTATTVGIRGFAGSTAVFDSGAQAFPELPMGWYSMELQPSGGNVNWALTALTPSATSGNVASGSYAGTVGNVTDVYPNPAASYNDTVIGHVSVQSAWVSLFSLSGPLDAWQGEAAGSRFARVAGENGFQVRVTGAPAATAAMGAQPIDTLSNILQQCEDADRGQIFEPRQCLGLGYRTLASMLNQAPRVTLDYSLAQPGGVSGGGDSGLDPVYDDQYTRNDLIVTRSSGSVSGATYQYQLNDGSAMSIASPPAGVGDYGNSANVNVQADEQLGDEAGWMVHVGTVDEARWPAIPLNLARTQLASLYYTLLGCDIGDYAQIQHLLNQITYDPVKQLVWQVKESLGGFHHTLEWCCVPESPYEVIILDDPVYGRVDTDGSTLHAGATSTATTMQVDTAGSFPLWTTAAADFPFDVAISGERITVTNITGSSSPQTFTVTRSVNGVVKAQLAGADVRLWFPPILSMV